MASNNLGIAKESTIDMHTQPLAATLMIPINTLIPNKTATITMLEHDGMMTSCNRSKMFSNFSIKHAYAYKYH